MEWSSIRVVGLLDFFLSLFGHVVYLSLGIYAFKYRNEDDDGPLIVNNSSQPVSTAPGSYERRYIFYLFSNFLLVLQLIAAVVLFGASFKGEFRKQFNACILWMFIALVSLTILCIQIFICRLKYIEILTCSLEIFFRAICAAFIINYMRKE